MKLPLLILILCLFMGVIITDHDALIIAYLLCSTTLALLSPTTAIYAAILSLPLAPYQISFLVAPLATLTIFSMAIAALARDCFQPTKNQKLLAFFSLVIFLSAINLFSILLHNNNSQIPHLTLLAVSAYYLIEVYELVSSKRVHFTKLILFLSIGILLASAYHIAIGEYVSSAKRLGIGGNVRALANSAGFCSITALSFAILAPSSKQLSTFVKKNTLTTRPIFFAAVGLISMGLLALSISRGVMISVGASVAIALLIMFFTSNSKFTFYLSMIVLITIPLLPYALYVSLGDETISTISQRFSNLDSGMSARIGIWEAGVSSMNTLQWIIGCGPASYRSLAEQHNYDMNSHSAFVDIFSSFGLMGIILFLFLFLYPVFKSLVLKNYIVIPILIYIVTSHLSHGAANSITFLFFIAFTIGLSNLSPLLNQANQTNTQKASYGSQFRNNRYRKTSSTITNNSNWGAAPVRGRS